MDIETDDFGTPAMVLATLSGGGVLRIAAGSLVRVTDDAEPGVRRRRDRHANSFRFRRPRAGRG